MRWIYQPITCFQESALYSACKGSHIEVVKLLVDRADLNVNAWDSPYRGYTSFLWACEGGHIEIVKLLISRDDLDINTQDRNGCTALHYVCMAIRGHIEVVKLLISRDDLDINRRNKMGYTAFLCAYLRGVFQDEEIVWLGVQICARCEFHPSELLGNYGEKEGEMSEKELRRRKEIELQISNALSKRKSARK